MHVDVTGKQIQVGDILYSALKTYSSVSLKKLEVLKLHPNGRITVRYWTEYKTYIPLEMRENPDVAWKGGWLCSVLNSGKRSVIVGNLRNA
jgi:hypothetical protein